MTKNEFLIMLMLYEELFKKGFYTLAFIRTLVCVIFLVAMLGSCGSIEYAYSEARWTAHQLHFSENMDMPDCQWCIDYNTMIP